MPPKLGYIDSVSRAKVGTQRLLADLVEQRSSFIDFLGLGGDFYRDP